MCILQFLHNQPISIFQHFTITNDYCGSIRPGFMQMQTEASRRKATNPKGFSPRIQPGPDLVQRILNIFSHRRMPDLPPGLFFTPTNQSQHAITEMKLKTRHTFSTPYLKSHDRSVVNTTFDAKLISSLLQLKDKWEIIIS